MLYNFLILLALTLSLIQLAFFIIKKDGRISVSLKSFEYIKFITLILLFVLLEVAFINSDFSLRLVGLNSDRTLPLVYKIFALLGSHEGSMLLWIIIMGAYSIAILHLNIFDEKHKYNILQIHNLVTALFILYLLLLANPFTATDIITESGLTPVLQDPFLLIHPPKLYLGYVGTSILYSAAIGFLIGRRKLAVNHCKQFHYLIIFVWATLTAGVILGSKWAYKELGWGGFWAWDPVENISLIPWLIVTALLHVNMALQRGKNLLKLMIILSLSSFISVVFGTLLVRAGALESVHSFALNKQGGIGMAAILLIVITLSIICYRSSILHLEDKPIAFGDRYKAITGFFIELIAVLLIGLLLPLILPKITIEVSYYNILCAIITIPLLILCSLTSTGKLNKVACFTLTSILFLAACIYLIKQIIPAFTFQNGLNLILILCACHLISTTILQGLKTKYRAVSVAHIGFSFLLIGAIFASAFSSENDLIVRKGVSQAILNDFNLTFVSVDHAAVQNYYVRTANLDLYKGKTYLGTLKPQIKYYPVSDMFTVKSDTLTTNFSDFYVILGAVRNRDDKANNNEMEIKIYYKPLIGLVWFGGLMIFFSAFYIVIQLFQRKKSFSIKE